MFDFTWKSYFKAVTWVWGVWVIFFLGGIAYIGITDPAPFTDNDKYEAFCFVFVSWPVIAFCLLLPYGLFAPFLAVYSRSRAEGATRSEAFGAVGANLILLAIVGAIMAVCYYLWFYVLAPWASTQTWGKPVAFIIGAIVTVATLASWWNALRYRLFLNKLNIFKPSNSRVMAKKTHQ